MQQKATRNPSRAKYWASTSDKSLRVVEGACPGTGARPTHLSYHRSPRMSIYSLSLSSASKAVHLHQPDSSQSRNKVSYASASSPKILAGPIQMAHRQSVLFHAEGGLSEV